ncbi:hypothetical protein Tco_1488810 [Tanacetum coccineum]
MSGEELAPQMAPVESPQMISTIKLPMLKKGEYTLWSMRMEQYLTNTDYGLWQVIMNGDEPVQTTKDKNSVETEVPPKTAQAILARQKERKAKSIMLLAIPDEYQMRFHTIKDAKSLWAAIKKRLDKAYDRFQKLINLLEVHGAAVPNEDANQKFLRALPSSWNNVALIMRNKDGIDDLDIDDPWNKGCKVSVGCLDKAYDRFQKLIRLLEVHGAAISNEDENQKFLRALPSSWNNVALIMRNKAGIDDLDIDDL